MMTGASPKGRRSAPPKLAWAPLRASTGMAPSAFLFSARWRLSRALKERDDRDDEIARLKSKVGEITMDNELLYAKIEALGDKRPLAHMYGPAVRRKRVSSICRLFGLASMYPASDWSMCSGPPWISARVRSH